MAKYRVPVLETFCWQEPVIRMDLNDPPGSGMAKGDRYIVVKSPAATGLWVGHENDIAWWNGSIWEFDSPENGWKVFNNGFDGATNDDESFYRYDLTEDAWIKDQLASFVLGEPSDESFADGLLDFTTETPAVDAIDDINEVLKDIAPPDAESLAGKVLTDNVSWVTGKLPTGLDNDYYQGTTANNATAISKIIHTHELKLDTPDTNKCFNKGDSGLLIVKHTAGDTAEVTIATLDIEANDDSSHRNFFQSEAGVRPATQAIGGAGASGWNGTGDGDVTAQGKVAFTNTSTVGELIVENCGGYTGEDGLTPIFNMWQKMNAQIDITTLQPGYNAFKLIHDLPADQESAEYEVWYDHNTDALSFSVPPTIVEAEFTSNKYISGVRYYSDDDTFDVAFTGANVFKNCYRQDIVARHRFDARSGDTNITPGDVNGGIQDISSVVNVATLDLAFRRIAINRSTYYSLDARLTAYLFHPWKTLSGHETASENRHVCTYGSMSTDTHEYFRDELHRLDPAGIGGSGDYITVPGSITGNWTSANVLDPGNALVYDEQVQYPNIDLSSGILPVQPSGRNYTSSNGFTGDQVYCRAFYKNESNGSVNINLGGFNVSNISQVGSGSVNIEVKLPSETEWLDAAISLDPGTFNGTAGQGCQNVGGTSGNTLALTFGGRYTVESGGMIIVKVTFRTGATQIITSMSVDW
jgi:hypothetical protein